MMRPWDICLGDVVRAFGETGLAPGNDDTRRAIASLLGFDWTILAKAKPDVSDPPEIPPPGPEPVRPLDPTSESDVPGGSIGDTGGAWPTEPLGPVRRDVSPLRAPAWQSAEALDPFQAEVHTSAIPHYRPLFVPNWTRSIVAASVSIRVAGGAVDMNALLEIVARAGPVAQIPRLPIRSLSHGVQVLIDIGEGMQPFDRDQRDLVCQIERVVGRDAVQIWQFDGCPLRGAGPGAVWNWKPYEPPPRGTPVVVVTDLGIVGSCNRMDSYGVEDWIEFGRLLATHSTPVVAFVPYPKRRWPRSLRHVIPIICWDRRTTNQVVCNTVWRH